MVLFLQKLPPLVGLDWIFLFRRPLPSWETDAPFRPLACLLLVEHFLDWPTMILRFIRGIGGEESTHPLVASFLWELVEIMCASAMVTWQGLPLYLDPLGKIRLENPCCFVIILLLPLWMKTEIEITKHTTVSKRFWWSKDRSS